MQDDTQCVRPCDPDRPGLSLRTDSPYAAMIDPNVHESSKRPVTAVPAAAFLVRTGHHGMLGSPKRVPMISSTPVAV